MNEICDELPKTRLTPEMDIKCVNCLFFDPRTCFCRKGPPQVIVNRDGFFSSMFPKISFPLLDFCYQHKSIESKRHQEIINEG